MAFANMNGNRWSILLITVLCSFLLYAQVRAASIDEALTANQRGENEHSLTMLKDLAQQGDPVAKYDLGLLYKTGTGDAENPQLAEYWFKQAANDGLVTAYLQLNNSAIQPGRVPVTGLKPGPEEWIRLQDPTAYTLQLASSKNSDLIQRNYYAYQLEGQGGYFLNKTNHRHILIFGSYPSVASARAAIGQLPEALRQWKPWVRPMRQILSSMTSN